MLPPCIQCQRSEIGVVHVRQSAAATVFRPVGLCENVLVRQRADRNSAARICRHADEAACEAIAMAAFHRHGRVWPGHVPPLGRAGRVNPRVRPGDGYDDKKARDDETGPVAKAEYNRAVLSQAMTMTKGQLPTRSARPGKNELQLAEATPVETIGRAACRCSNIVSVAKNDKLNDQITLHGEIESNHQRVR